MAGSVDRERRVNDLFVALADTLVAGAEVIDFLYRLVDGCRDVLDVDAVGVLLAREGDRLGLTAASSESMRVLELHELQEQTGPCYAAYVGCERVAVPDLGEHRDRWPGFVELALQRGFRSAYAFPLRLRGDAIGALNVFGTQVTTWAPRELHLAQSLADVATIGILQHRAVEAATVRAEQLQTALESRVVIERAKGIVSERFGIDGGAAFDRIRAYSQERNIKLRRVCERIVAGEVSEGDLSAAAPPAGRR